MKKSVIILGVIISFLIILSIYFIYFYNKDLTTSPDYSSYDIVEFEELEFLTLEEVLENSSPEAIEKFNQHSINPNFVEVPQYCTYVFSPLENMFNEDRESPNQIQINSDIEYDGFLNSLYSKYYNSYLDKYEVYYGEDNYSLQEYKEICGFYPEIDFSRHILLGQVAKGSGCSREFKKNLYKDDINKRFIYVIKVIEHGGCKPLEIGFFWIKTSKIPEDYTIEFEVIK